MPFTKVTKTRSICINGDWDGVHYEFTLNEGQPLSEAENLLSEAVNKWENETRAKRIAVFDNLPVFNVKEPPPYSNIDQEFADLKKAIEEAPTREAAELLMQESCFGYNLELKKIINQKP